ncbi:MAG: toll/interleukin-1 receptor domain-containing protein [Bryobacterales bacterium]|nr:toll/interleukin-1 receptor domain-containing protein [Bryobacterales bacterium]
MSAGSQITAEPFANDVFISYAHEDNQPLPPQQQGWVDLFEVALRAYLGKTAGDPPRIWRDPTLERSGNLDEHIRRHLQTSAVLLCVVSRSYIQSGYCLEELNHFLTKFGDDSRIVKVVTASLPDENQHPPPLNKSIGYPFFELDERTRRAYELDADDEASRRIYRRLLYDLAREVAERLLAVKGSAAVREPVATVYLARTSFDLNEQREALRGELEANGVCVLPKAPLPSLAADCETEVQEWLRRSVMSIHLIGKFGGGAPDGPRDESYVELQHRLSVEHRLASNPNLTSLLWMVPQPDPEDLDHVRFVARLKNDPATYDSADLIQGSFEEFKAAVLRRAIDASRPVVPAQRPSRAYLIYHADDEAAIGPLDDALGSHGIEVRLPVFVGDASARARDHAAALTEADWAIVYWGSGDELWFNHAVAQLRNSQSLGRQSALRSAVCLAPPASRRKERCLSQPRPELVISLLNGASETSLRTLLDAIGRGS